MKDEKTSRRERRRRRLRNQFFAYLMLVIIILLVLAAGYFGVKGVLHYLNDYNDRVNKVIEEAESSAAAEQESEPGPLIEEATGVGIEHDEGYASPVEADPLDGLIESLLGNMTVEEISPSRGSASTGDAVCGCRDDHDAQDPAGAARRTDSCK